MLSSSLSIFPGIKNANELRLDKIVLPQLDELLNDESSASSSWVLFYGEAGAGKKRAAQYIAFSKKQAAYRVDLSQVVSKFIGDTEKNLDRVFKKAAEKNAILFFDEADALFGRRTRVKDANDRYASIKLSWLFNKMESHQGLIIISTKTKSNLDNGFIRRLRYTLSFDAS